MSAEVAQMWICTSCGFIYDPDEGDPDGDHGGGGTGLGDLAGVQLLAWRGPVDPHAATLLTFAAV